MLKRRALGWFCVACVALGVAWNLPAQQAAPAGAFSSTTIDFGLVCSDVDKSVAWYRDVVGMKEAGGFDIPAGFAGDTGLSKELPFHVYAFVLGEGANATKLKLMQFKTAPGARVDQSFIHSTIGIRYITIHVTDLNAAVARAAQHGARPIAKGPVGLPEGFPQGVGLANFRDPDGNLVELVGPWKQ